MLLLALFCSLRRTSSARLVRLSASQSPFQCWMDAASAGRASRAPAAASILLCRASAKYCSDHAVKPRMMPWLPMRLIAFCARCSTRCSFSCCFCSAIISSVVPVSATLCISSSLSSSFCAACFA